MPDETDVARKEPKTTTRVGSVPDFDNPHNHYYLDQNDTTTTGVVTHVLVLDNTNYHTWNRAFLIQLTLKNKKCFIDGTIEQPGLGDPNLRAWVKFNTLIIAWMMNSVAHEIKKHHTLCRNCKRSLGDLENKILRTK